MSDFKAKIHQNTISAGVLTRPQWGAYRAPQTMLAVLKGPTSSGGSKEGGVAWLSGSTLVLINVVTLRRARLILG